MNKPLIITGILLASIAAAGCSNDTQTNAPASASTAAATPAGVTHPMEPSPTPPQAAPAAPVASYQIPPFPVTNVDVCDHYASEARRCLNQVASDDKRHAYEQDIKALLEKVTPKPGEPVNEWLTSDCVRGMDSIAQRFPQCTIQK